MSQFLCVFQSTAYSSMDEGQELVIRRSTLNMRATAFVSNSQCLTVVSNLSFLHMLVASRPIACIRSCSLNWSVEGSSCNAGNWIKLDLVAIEIWRNNSRFFVTADKLLYITIINQCNNLAMFRLKPNQRDRLLYCRINLSKSNVGISYPKSTVEPEIGYDIPSCLWYL